MPKFKILIVDNEGNKYVTTPLLFSSPFSFESRAEATKAYHEIIAKLEDEVNNAKERLHNVVENGHIVEVEEDG